MKKIPRLAIASFLMSATLFGAEPESDFRQHLGLQLWSLREKMKESVPAGLDQVKAYGFKEVETAGTYGLAVSEFLALLHERGLTPVAAHMPYDAFNKDVGAVIRDVQTLGAKYALIAWMPFPKTGFDVATARAAAANFNKWGEALKAAGLRFAYHPHGYEFAPLADRPGETAFDVLVRETNPEFVSFEMDVFWVFHAGQDPVTLLERYPDRWALLHVKDIRQGAVTGLATGRAAPTDNVPVGKGQIDWPAVLRTAQKIGVKYYFIEDETPAPLQNIPQSLEYLRTLKL